MLKRLLTIATAICATSLSAQAGNVTPYYLLDGDSQRAAVIVNGVVTNSFTIPSLGYPVAIQGSSVWIGHRDNAGGTEYTLAGVPTGNTSPGGAVISQILDGTTNGTNNFGATCCGTVAVTIANNDWSGQSVLFTLPTGAAGIAYDPITDSLFVSFFDATVRQYGMTGSLLGSFAASLVGLAYESATDTLWGWDRNNSALLQYSKTGTLLETNVVDLDGTGISNPFGGEMAFSASTTEVPEPAAIALFCAGLLGLAGLRTHRRIPNIHA
jgi:hypothetical protein